MRRALKWLLKVFAKPIDFLFVTAAAPAALILLAYRRIGSARLPWTSRLLKRIGLFPVRRHYYEPLFDDSQLTRRLSEDRDLPGVDLNVAGQLELLAGLRFSRELVDLKLDSAASALGDFRLDNGAFESGDAEFLYQFIRAVKPRKVIEIGSGNSTKIARIALNRNFEETGARARHLCIEPYEMSWLEKLDGVEVVRQRVEESDLDWRRELERGDLLFIDSSHVVRPQGDVLKEYLEILPQLASGVYVHIHDVFTPRDYLRQWVVEDVRFWNEQYLLEALLSNTARYEVIAALNHLRHHHYEVLKQVCPYLTEQREPGSFYIRVR
jgi:hypothetical protein